ncbi:MAG: spermidine/putrescine ABC transporter substrate-binding protein, partial [Verrucomicrobiota bacterium]
GACSERKEALTSTLDRSSPGQANEAKQVVLYSWDEYFNEELFTEFEERTGIEVIYETFEDSEEMQERLKSSPGAYDVVVVDEVTTAQLMEKRLLTSLDRTRLTNFQNLAPRYLYDTEGKDPGNRFSVPYTWGTTLIAYRSDKIEDPQRNWSLLYSEDYANKCAMIKEPQECYAAALLHLGFDPNTNDPEELEAAKNLLSKMVEEHGLRFGSDNNMKELLKSGEAWVVAMYSGDAALIADEAEDENIDFFIPSEGAIMWIDNFVIPRDSERTSEAHAFINFMLEAEVAAESSNFLWYATPNEAASPYLNEELVSDERIYPPAEVLDRCTFLNLLPTQTERLINQGWAEVQRSYLQKSANKRVAKSATEE